MLTINNNIIIIPNINNINPDDYNASKNDLWNKDSLKKYMLNILNMLKFSYFTLLKILLALLINDIIYQIPTIHDKDSYDTSFKL